MSPHKCDSSLCLQRLGAEPAIFSKSPIYKLHSLYRKLMVAFLPHQKLQNTSNRCPFKTAPIKEDNWKDVGKFPEVVSDQGSYSASLSLQPTCLFSASLHLLPSFTCFSLKASSPCLLRSRARPAAMWYPHSSMHHPTETHCL